MGGRGNLGEGTIELAGLAGLAGLAESSESSEWGIKFCHPPA